MLVCVSGHVFLYSIDHHVFSMVVKSCEYVIDNEFMLDLVCVSI